MSRKLKPNHAPLVPKRQPPKWQRERNISLLLWILIPIVILITLALVSYWAYDSYVAVWNRPIAKVNETTFDMDYFVKMFRFSSRLQGESYSKTQVFYDTLQQIEDDELVRQKAFSLDILIPPEEVKESINSFITGGQGNLTQSEFDDQYQLWLDYIDLSDNEYRQLVETDLLRQELGEYFKEQEVPKEAKQVHLLAIVRSTEEEALTALEQLRSGNVTLTQELSESDLGWVPKGIYPELDATVFTLEPGNITEPISIEQGYNSIKQGYNLIKVLEIDENMALTDEHRNKLAQKVFEGWLLEARLTSVTEYVDQEKIEWAIDQIT